MKHLFFMCCLGLLALATQARTAIHSLVPADTVTGHAHLVRKLTQELCTKLTNDHTTAFNSLTPPQAMQLTQQLFTDAMQRDSVALLAMMHVAAQHNMEPQQIGQLLGQDVVIELSKSCPAALPLLTRLSQTEQAQETIKAQQHSATSEAEKKVLQPLATHLCAQLAAADAKNPLAKQTPAQRKALFTTLIQKELTISRPQLLKYYSAAQLTDVTRMQEIGQKIALLMLAQDNCGQYMMQLGADTLTK